MENGFLSKLKAPVSPNLLVKKIFLSHYLLESVGLSRIAHYFADRFAIKRAYKRLALQFHPDKVCTQCNIVSLIMAVLSFCCSNSLFWCFKVSVYLLFDICNPGLLYSFQFAPFVRQQMMTLMSFTFQNHSDHSARNKFDEVGEAFEGLTLGNDGLLCVHI